MHITNLDRNDYKHKHITILLIYTIPIVLYMYINITFTFHTRTVNVLNVEVNHLVFLNCSKDVVYVSVPCFNIVIVSNGSLF
jgi:hypothetical protein